MRLPTLSDAAWIFIGAVTLANPARAFYESDPQFIVRGFGTVGAVYNPSEHLEFVRDFSQPEGARDGWNARPDSVIGVQLNTRPAQKWEVVVQVVSRYGYDDDYRPRLSWAFAKYSPSANVAFRGGRLGYDAYLEGDSRNVGYSFLPVRLPIEYYGTLELSHIDGADAVFTLPVGSSLLALKLFAGRANEELAVGAEDNYDLKGSGVAGGSLNYQVGAWRLRLGASRVHLDNEIASLAALGAALRSSGGPAAARTADDIALAGANVDNANIGVVYEAGALRAQLLYNERSTDTLVLPDGRALYGLIGYRVGAWTPYVFAAESDGEADDFNTGLPPGHPLDRAVAELMASAPFEQRSYGLGVRRDIGASADLKLQIEQIDAERAETSYFVRSDPRWDGNATVVSVAVDFVF